jgi:SpoVK/Ycf46/Vps4 family AAA+-type ATPase
MSDDQAVLCPASVRGFSLANKKWVFFLVDKVTDVKWNTDALDKLELKDESKDTINALVKAHGRQMSSLQSQFRDIIPGKGLGLVFLLAGAPGLGKTLTAEVVAEHHRKALYAITSGEIGSEGLGIDHQMRKIFERAKAWDAYLLLDEADVFLAERVRNDVSRNGLVTGKSARRECRELF